MGNGGKPFLPTITFLSTIPTPSPYSEASSLIHKPFSLVERLPLPEMFPSALPLEVELGSGDGSFLAQWAEAHPERNFLGVERLLGRLRKLDRKGQRRGLRNLQLVRIEASYFLGYMLPPASVRALHIYFPDPWPKRKHRRHRLIQEPFLAIAARALEPDGIVYLRTDDEDYFTQMVAVFGASAQFKPVETPPELMAVVTDFERNFLLRGVATRRAAYQRKPVSPGEGS